MAAAGAFDPIWTAASDTEKKSLTDEREKILTGFASQYPSYPARFELAKMAAAKGTKDKDAVFNNLIAAAQINQQGVADPAGQANFSDIARATDQYREQGLLTKDQVGQIQEKLDSFRDEKLRYDAQSLQEQKQEAIEKAKEEAARAKAEAAKPKPAAPAMPAPTGIGKGVRALPPGPAGAAPAPIQATPVPPTPKPAVQTTGAKPATTPAKTPPPEAKPTVKIVPTPVGGGH
jgi:hypothetical protein